GTAIITINAGNILYNVTITYSPSGATERHISSAAENTIIISHGESFYLTFDESLGMTDVSYTLQDNNVLKFIEENKSFSSTGSTLGGKTSILATSSNKNQIEFLVIVTKQVSDIKYQLSENINNENLFDNTTNTIYTAKTAMSITCNVLPADATTEFGETPEITYAINDNSIATIDKVGNITFLKPGKITLTISSQSITKTFTITSTFGFVTSATLTPTSINAEYTDNLYYDLLVSKYPIDANDSCISFTSSNTNVAVIEDSKVKIVGGGKASITMTALTSNSSYILANCDVNITRAASSVNISHNNADVTNGSIDTNSLSYKINYSVLPNDNTDYVTFSTTSNIASVNSSGVVTFTDPGTALINVCSIHSATSSVSTYSTVSVTYTPSGAIKQNISQDNQTIVVNNLDSFFFVFNNDLDMYNISYSNLGSLISFDSVTKKFTALNGSVTLIKATSSNGNVLNVKVIATKQASDIEYIVSENVNKDGVYDANTNTINTAQTTMTISSTVVDEFATTSNGNKPVVSYESSDNTIATVNSNGNVTFLKAGTITLTLSVDNVSKKFTIFSSFGYVTNASFSVSQNGLDISNIDTEYKDNLVYNINVNKYPVDVDDSKIMFSCQNSSIAKISNNVLEIIGVGSTTLTMNAIADKNSFITLSFAINITKSATDIIVE
ncbi:MAG: Ig-like domain-containing protein, partial [Clostridia bacterium]|nr:Ig-like domain-containing protein [Clostridia bacterium]